MSGADLLRAVDFALTPTHGTTRYALVDAGQCPGFVKATQAHAQGTTFVPVFGEGSLGSAAALGPWLVGTDDSWAALDWLSPWAAQLPGKPTMSFLQSTLPPPALAHHLSDHLYAHDPDGQEWLLAWWDPQVLAALIGSPDDDHVLVQGPVLSADQRAAFMAPIKRWVYFDAASELRVLPGGEAPFHPQTRPLALTQAQMDQLTRVNWVDELMRNVLEAWPAAEMDLPALRQLCLDVARQSPEGDMPTDMDTVLTQWALGRQKGME